jgi:NAD(P)-dependent dehydrogenase (short-subunit alcohol dehydrogenase family)
MPQTVLITGANGNLGSAVTRTFLDRGYSVIATVVDEAARKELPAHPHLQAIVVDLTDEAATAAFISQIISEKECVDAALLLVGGFAMGSIADTSGSDIRKQVLLNFDTAYHVTRPLLAHMKEKKKGRIVFIGARPALQPADGKNLVAYALSKSLLFRLAECINEETKGTDVTATVVVPSTLDTATNRKSMPDADPDLWVKPEALAGILEFICSEAAAPLRESVLKVYNNA